jgi:hypothetical protein
MRNIKAGTTAFELQLAPIRAEAREEFAVGIELDRRTIGEPRRPSGTVQRRIALAAA